MYKSEVTRFIWNARNLEKENQIRVLKPESLNFFVSEGKGV